MAIEIVKLGTPRKSKDLRLGTVRRPPRGVKKEDFSKLDYYDVWMPVLSPSLPLMKFALQSKDNQKAWNQFIKKFKVEMKKPEASHALDLLAALSHRTNISLGCYCEDENRCHRSILKELLLDRGADLKA
jgi:uncharacterized protein YeaO (DUF488 family)